jgi:hypothetical protein
MRTIIARTAGALGLAAVGLVAGSAATAHADTGGINITFGGVTYSCNPCTSTSAKTTTTYGGQTLSTNATTDKLYVNNTTSTSNGTTITNNFYGGTLGVWAGQSTTTPDGTTSGGSAGYYTKTGTFNYTTLP